MSVKLFCFWSSCGWQSLLGWWCRMPDMNLKVIPVMREALEAIRELHPLGYEIRPLYTTSIYNPRPAGTAEYRICANCKTHYPCPTRVLADRALGAGNE